MFFAYPISEAELSLIVTFNGIFYVLIID